MLFKELLKTKHPNLQSLKTDSMRLPVCIVCVFLPFLLFAQQANNTQVSGVILSSDSIPIPDVAVIHPRTGLAVRTNSTGFFQTMINENDSLLLFHISYKKRFVKATSKQQYIILESEVQELMQIDVLNQQEKEARNLQQTLSEIKRAAPMQTLTGYDLHSKTEYFVRDNGSHNKAFMPFFGPTLSFSLNTILKPITNQSEKRARKKLTGHYHLIKPK